MKSMSPGKNPASITAVYWLVHVLLIILVLSTIYFGADTVRRFERHVANPDIYYPPPFMQYLWASVCVSVLKVVLSVIPLILFRRFFKNVRQRNVFSEINLRYLKKGAYVLLALCLVELIEYLLYINWADGFLCEALFNLYYGYSMVWKLTAAIFTWSLAHIFSVGLTLQQEKDLTI